MASDIVKDHSNSYHMGYSFQLAAEDVLYALSHRKDSTYHGLCYTSCGAKSEMRNISMSAPQGFNYITHHTMSTKELHIAAVVETT